jgi:hypothetical protein
MKKTGCHGGLYVNFKTLSMKDCGATDSRPPAQNCEKSTSYEKVPMN